MLNVRCNFFFHLLLCCCLDFCFPFTPWQSFCACLHNSISAEKSYFSVGKICKFLNQHWFKINNFLRIWDNKPLVWFLKLDGNFKDFEMEPKEPIHILHHVEDLRLKLALCDSIDPLLVLQYFLYLFWNGHVAPLQEDFMIYPSAKDQSHWMLAAV